MFVNINGKCVPLTNYLFMLDCFVGVVYNENIGKEEGIGYMPVKNCSFKNKCFFQGGFSYWVCALVEN